MTLRTRCILSLSLAALVVTVTLAPAAGTAWAGEAEGDAEEPDPRRVARRIAFERTELTPEEQLLIRRPDRQRPSHPLAIPVFGRPLTIGGRYTVLGRYDHDKLIDFDFDDLDDDDLDEDGDVTEPEDAARGQTPTDDQLRVNQALQMDLFYPVTDQIAVYLESIVSFRSLVWADERQSETDWLFERGESWLYLGNILGSPVGLQVGRQRFFDDREWWWDQDLDAVRVRLDFRRFHAEVAVAQELFPVEYDSSRIDPEEKDVLRILGSAHWEWARRHEVRLFALYQDDHSSDQALFVDDSDPPLPCVPEDEFPPGLPEEAKEFFRSGCPPTVGFEDESDADLAWFGFSANGRIRLRDRGRLLYRIDAAGVLGDERFTDYSGPTGSRVVGAKSEHDVAGGGVDVGATWELPLPFRPSITLGYAFGSGRKGDTEDRDRGFRQTGLQDDNDRLLGVASLRYYGELLDPELSNLHIFTAGVGFRFLRKSSIDLIYHKYRQVEPADFLRDVDFKRDPDGVHRDIGDEWDLVLGIEDYQPFELKLVGSIFRAGEAFRPKDGDLSYLVSLRLRLNL